MYLQLIRFSQSDKQTLGHLFVRNSKHQVIAVFATLELPWKENNPNISCVPLGTYQVTKRWSPKFNNHFLVSNVLGRSLILIHSGNFVTQTQGCILLGLYHSDINTNSLLDVVASRAALVRLNDLFTTTNVYLSISDIKNIEVL